MSGDALGREAIPSTPTASIEELDALRKELDDAKKAAASAEKKLAVMRAMSEADSKKNGDVAVELDSLRERCAVAEADLDKVQKELDATAEARRSRRLWRPKPSPLSAWTRRPRGDEEGECETKRAAGRSDASRRRRATRRERRGRARVPSRRAVEGPCRRGVKRGVGGVEAELAEPPIVSRRVAQRPKAMRRNATRPWSGCERRSR